MRSLYRLWHGKCYMKDCQLGIGGRWRGMVARETRPPIPPAAIRVVASDPFAQLAQFKEGISHAHGHGQTKRGGDCGGSAPFILHGALNRSPFQAKPEETLSGFSTLPSSQPAALRDTGPIVPRSQVHPAAR